MDVGPLANLLAGAIAVLTLGAALVASRRFLHRRSQRLSADAEVARHLLAFLAERRVLLAARYDKALARESPTHVILVVMGMRQRFGSDLERLDPSCPLAQSLQLMQTACRDYLAVVPNQQAIPWRIITIRQARSDTGPRVHAFVVALVKLQADVHPEIAHIAMDYHLPFSFNRYSRYAFLHGSVAH